MIRCVIFDFDGTLVDSETLCNQAFLDVIPSLNTSVENLTGRYTGGKLAWIFSDIEQQFKCTMPPAVEQLYRNRVTELFQSSLQAFEGVHQVLDNIALPICIATSAPLGKVEPALAKTNLAKYFSKNVYSSYTINSWKPEPDIFLHAAEKMNVAPQNCLVVEDSKPGIQAATAAGMKAVQFCSSGQSFHSNVVFSYAELEHFILAS